MCYFGCLLLYNIYIIYNLEVENSNFFLFLILWVREGKERRG